jgi:hypothetical protein
MPDFSRLEARLLHRFGFWLALLACVGLTALCFAGLATALRGFGVNPWL